MRYPQAYGILWSFEEYFKLLKIFLQFSVFFLIAEFWIILKLISESFRKLGKKSFLMPWLSDKDNYGIPVWFFLMIFLFFRCCRSTIVLQIRQQMKKYLWWMFTTNSTIQSQISTTLTSSSRGKSPRIMHLTFQVCRSAPNILKSGIKQQIEHCQQTWAEKRSVMCLEPTRATSSCSCLSEKSKGLAGWTFRMQNQFPIPSAGAKLR